MTSPAALPVWILPAWIPWWAQLALFALALLFLFAFLMMPFAVFGLKGRLDLLEAQLDDIHAEIRVLAMRLPDVEPLAIDRQIVAEQAEGRTGTIKATPLRGETRHADERQPARDQDERSEPRLNWPKPRDPG